MSNLTIVKFASKFVIEEDGAVTVDWVVLTAATVLLGAIVVGVIKVALDSTATDISSSIVAAANAIS